MEAISLKLDETILSEIDNKLAKYRYSTRTEFIRDAIRSKLSELEKQNLLKAIEAGYGTSRRKTTGKQLHAAGEKAFHELEKHLK
jgi:metal-responsive CopG/Arc/MetJ family transcriptional regulator